MINYLVKLIGTIALLGFCVSTHAGTPATYYDTADETTSATLRSTLNDIISGGHIYVNFFGGSSFPAIETIDEEPTNPSNVRLIYTGDSRIKSAHGGNNSDPASGGWDREHLWPQSYVDMDLSGDGDHPMVDDFHALRPADADVNARRSNSPFDYVASPTQVDAFGNRSTTSLFEPQNASKGDAARALLYMDVRYEGEFGEPNLELVNTSPGGTGSGKMAYRDTLIQWHLLDPPDAYERIRNSKVHNAQGNSNPFVDRPEWVEKVFGGAAWTLENGTTLTVSHVNRAVASASAGAPILPMLSLNLGVEGKEWHVGSISVSNIGSSGDGGVAEIGLWHDVDNSGSASATDTLLTTASLTGGNALLAPPDPFYLATGTMNLLITVTAGGSAPHNSTVQLRVNANGILHDARGGFDVDPAFAAIVSDPTILTNGNIKLVALSVRSGANAASNEYVSLANHNDVSLNLTGWTIKRRSGGDLFDNTLVTLTNSIGADGHYLIATSGYGSDVEGTGAPEQSATSFGLGDTTGISLSLFNPAGYEVDGFSMRSGSTTPGTLGEGVPFAGGPSTGTQAQNGIVRRKRPAGNTGGYTDTNNNATDLEFVQFLPTGSPKPPPRDTSVPVTLSGFSAE